ncbi:hypothetical protein R1sor_007866 [Riccia sorocarpa]|uniref:Uncharacterized protein n=1 Tax=Riccia sorocarpa TaxID=122646 RepID=A0ABD3HRQ1_9MARC
MDRKSKLASEGWIKGSQSYMVDNTLPDVGGSRDAENVPISTTGEKSYPDRHSLPNPSIMVVSRSTAYRHAKALLGSVNRSFNFPVAEECFPTDEHVDADLDGGRACVETILTILFGSNAPSTSHLLPGGQPDYRDMSLGSLLRYAGHEWRGGELGLRGLSSLDGISRLYRDQGMPSVARWRLCMGEGDSAHEPRAYSYSKQDNYQCGGLKCRCASRPPSGLQRDCEGDPRNVALLAHWDGFQSASTVFRSTWTVETKILSAGASSPLPPMPVLFIPNTKGDPSSKSDALNACLQPFIEELIDLFINGVEVEFNYPSELIGGRDLPKRFKLRIMLVLFTGDHPAQCKFGGFATSGYSGCRRCKMKSRKLFDLYGFNPSEDLTYDAMHVLALSMFKKYTEFLKKDAERTSAGRDALLSALAEVTKKKARCLQGRWPKDPFNRLGFFKAEEYTNFILYCVPYILYEMGYEPGSILYDLGRLVFEIARYFYIASRSQTGWTEDMVNKCYMLFTSWRIRHEEGVGASGSILDHVAGAGELLDDVHRHGPSHVYWCYAFERLVSAYNKIKTNCKNMESTFISHYARTFFLQCCNAIWTDDDGLLPHQRIKTLLEENTVHLGNGNDSSASICRGILYWESVFGGHLESDEMSPRVTLLRSTMVKGNLYRAGDYAFVLSDSDDKREINWRWKTKITRLFAHTCRGETHMFFEGKWLFNSTARTGGQEHDRFDPISNMEILDQHERTAAGDSCRPVHMLECHFVPVLQKKPGDNHVLAISTGPYRRHSTLFEEAGIDHRPPHPEVNDVMLAVHLPDCPMTATEHCVITSVQVSDKGPTLAERGDVDGAVLVRGQTNMTVQVQWLKRTFMLRWEVNNRRSCCRSIPASQLRQRLEGYTRNSESRMWEHSPR